MKLIDKQLVQIVLRGCAVLLLGVFVVACKGGGGGGEVADGGVVEEEVVEPEDPRVEEEEREEKEAFFIKEAGQAVELEMTDGKFALRLECEAAVDVGYSGSVSGGEVRCYTEDEDTYDEVERRIVVQGGSWEQTVSPDAKLIAGMRFDLSGYDAVTNRPVQLRVQNVDLRVVDEAGGERVGYAEGACTVALNRDYVFPPNVSSLRFVLRKK